MKVIVTGCAGFIGSNLVDELLSRNISVFGVDNFDNFYDVEFKRSNISSALINTKFELANIDIRDKTGLVEYFEKVRPDIVIHLAAKAGVRNSIQDPYGYYDVNLIGTLNVLEAMRESGCNNCIMASSSSVYGNNDVPFSESVRADSQISPYASSKKALENLCHVYSNLYNLNLTCLRFFTVYGPRLRPDLAIYKFVSRILEGEKITIYGRGDTSRDYTYISDIIDGIIAAMSLFSGFKVFNLGGANPVKLSDLILEIEKAAGTKALIDYSDIPPGDVSKTYADIRKSRKELAFDPKVSLAEGIKLFIKWYKLNRL